MSKQKVIKITVETERVWVISRRQQEMAGWCPECGEQVRLMSAEAAAALTGLSLRRLCRQVEAGQLHFTELADQSLWICPNSLRTSTRRKS